MNPINLTATTNPGTDTAGAIADSQTRVGELSPTEALEHQTRGALLLDIREAGIYATGTPAGALDLPRKDLESRITGCEPDRSREILTLCDSGIRSLQAAETLRRLGYVHVYSVAGGFTRWKAEGLPVTTGNTLDADTTERYSRQLRLPQVGAEGQAKLAQAKVAMVGAGGLGAPAALYLTAAGIGTITLIDDDRVERSNLHRQVIHTDTRVGMSKTASAQLALSALNPSVNIQLRDTRLMADNVEDLLTGHDIIIDGADNFPTRYLLSAASQRLKLPLVYGAVERFAGQVSVFDPRRDDSPCYRCLFPAPPAAGDAPNCGEAGVLGVLPGLIGLLQATETIKLILGIGESLTGRLLTVDALNMRFRELKLPRNTKCPGCGPHACLNSYTDIVQSCTS